MHCVWMEGSRASICFAVSSDRAADLNMRSAGLSKFSWYSPMTHAHAPTIADEISAAWGVPALPSPAAFWEVERSIRPSARVTAYGRTWGTRALMSMNCSATSSVCAVSRFLEISARMRRYQAKSSTSAYLSREPILSIVPMNSSGGQVFLLNSMSFLTASTKVAGVMIVSRSCRAILRAVVSDSSMLWRTFAWRSLNISRNSFRVSSSLYCGISRSSLYMSSARNLRLRSDEFRKVWSFSIARATTAVPGGMVLRVQRIASNSTLWAFVVFRKFVSGSAIFAGSRGSSGQSSWKIFRSLMESQLLLVFIRMW
mmetsp:Transcript_114132/g.323190  ORF Transcript_114132/g.323190 Transcript_114132/m.323190 type:complete len:313 (-) Transcript_114132:729-1667(-)